jgi:hypothetical protein
MTLGFKPTLAKPKIYPFLDEPVTVMMDGL